MAGSRNHAASVSPFNDPILKARVEAIRQLAGGLSERVAVMDSSLNIIYANEAGWAVRSEGKAALAKCYEAFAHRHDPCGSCPAVKVFEGSDVQSVGCTVVGEGPSCGMYQAYPLMTEQGTVGSILVLFRHASPSGRSLAAAGLSPAGKAPQSMRESLGGLIGRSPVMQELFDMISLVAESSATVLIQGESGTGKELVAQTIHRLSGRHDRPFIVVDCGSLPETLLESELFGHVKGAFTGAVSNKRGLFEEADGGTVFLDEIADTTPTFQAKLLRALQEGEIKRVGGTHTVKIDVRVVSATNKDLTELIRAKAFRQDLYYRLAVLPLHLPALRDRREDIPLLVQHFLSSSCHRHHQALREIPDEVMRWFTEADWPGNVRELQHSIERSVVTTSGPALDCPERRSRGPHHSEDLRSVARDAARQAERARIIQALSQSSGNRAKAAKLLKISRASLYNKLRDYGVR